MKKKAGWKNKNKTGFTEAHESWRHSQSAKGIATTRNDQFVINRLSNYVRVQGNRVRVIRRRDNGIPRGIDRSKRKSRYNVTVHVGRRIRRGEKKKDHRDVVSLLDEVNTKEKAVKTAEEFALNNPKSVAFVSEHVGKIDGEDVYQNFESIRKRRGIRRMVTKSNPETLTEKYDEFKKDRALRDNSREEKYRNLRFQDIKQVHLKNDNRNIQKSIFIYNGQIILLRDGDDIHLNRSAFRREDSRDWDLLRKVQKRIR